MRADRPGGVSRGPETARCGESGHPGSPHFADQVQRYVSGQLRDVYFYRSQLVGHTERTYHPGE